MAKKTPPKFRLIFVFGLMGSCLQASGRFGEKNHYRRGGSLNLTNGDDIKGIINVVYDNYINDKNRSVFT